jgi:hypothetical protein
VCHATGRDHLVPALDADREVPVRARAVQVRAPVVRVVAADVLRVAVRRATDAAVIEIRPAFREVWHAVAWPIVATGRAGTL